MKNILDKQYCENLLKYSNVPIIIWDKELIITHYNVAFEKLTGRKAEDGIGKSIEIFFPESMVNTTIQLIRRVQAGERLEDTEVDIIHDNGFVNTVIWNFSPVFAIDEKTQIATIAQGHDITMRKRMEGELVHLNQQKELILSSVAEGVLGLDLEGRHTFVNPVAAKMLGYKPEELIGLPSHSIWHHTRADGSHYPHEECPIYAAFNDGKVHRGANDVFWKKGGKSFPVEFASMPIYEQNQLVGAVVTFTDITERKKIEEALNKSEQSMKSFVNDSLLCIYFFNTETKKITYANPSFYQLLGYLSDDIETLTIYDFLNHTKESVDSFVNHVVQTKQRNIGERQWKRRDGKVIDMFVNASYGDHNASKIIYISAQDISERKQAEKALQKSERFLKESQKVSKIGSYVLDIHSEKWKCTEGLCRILGFSENQEYTVRDWVSVIHPEHNKMMADYFELEVIGKKTRFEKEYIIINQKTKEEHWVNGIGELEFDSNNAPIRMIGTIQDITERKQAEIVLHESEERLKRGELVAKFGNWKLDLEKKIIYASTGAQKIYGSEKNELSLAMIQKFPLPEYREKLDESLRGLIGDEKPYDVEFKIKRISDGRIVDIHSVAEYDPVTKTIFGILQDITERKKAQQEIIESEKKFKSVLQSAKDSIVLANKKGEIIFWNHFAEKIFGYKENEVLGKPLSLIMPERHSVSHLQKFSHHVSTNQILVKDKIIELSGLKKNGDEFPIELSLSHWSNENEKFYCGIIRDITERKNAEEEQCAYIKKLSEIAFLQSHQVRSPIASLLGLINLFNFDKPTDPINSEVLSRVEIVAKNLDNVIQEIVKKTSSIERNSTIQ